MNIIDLYNDYGISYASETDRHYREGWINTKCPFCHGSEGNHLGYAIDHNFFSCFRCGWHPIPETVAAITGINLKDIKAILRQYQYVSFTEPKKVVKIGSKVFKFPTNTLPLQNNHRNYLISRKFDPDKLVRNFNLMGTGPISQLKEDKKVINYKHRIIIPFIWGGNKIVTFDSRSIGNVEKGKRYIACPKNREIFHRKHILYGACGKWTDTGICVEGPTDVWRFGIHAFATSGITFTPEQIREIAKIFKRVAVIFDGEITAQAQARKLVAELRCRNVDAFIEKIDGDPGELEQSEADYIVKQIIKK